MMRDIGHPRQTVLAKNNYPLPFFEYMSYKIRNPALFKILSISIYIKSIFTKNCMQTDTPQAHRCVTRHVFTGKY